MAGESWKSHKNTSLERDMDADHEAQLSDWAPPWIVTRQEIGQEIRDGYARDVDPGVARVRQETMEQEEDDLYGVSEAATERALKAADEAFDRRSPADAARDRAEASPALTGAMAEWARSTARTVGLDQPAPADSAEALQGRFDALRVRRVEEPAVRFAPPPVDPLYRADADYPRTVVANTRVAPAETVDPRTAPAPAPDTARFQTQLAIARQVAANQVRAQQQADAEAAERLASAALGQYIAPPRNAPARTPHR